MGSVYWDTHGILFIDYLEKGKTINSDHYMALLNRLNAEIKKKRSFMQRKKVLFYQNNAYFKSKDESFYKKGHRKVIEALECIYYA